MKFRRSRYLCYMGFVLAAASLLIIIVNSLNSGAVNSHFMPADRLKKSEDLVGELKSKGNNPISEGSIVKTNSFHRVLFDGTTPKGDNESKPKRDNVKGSNSDSALKGDNPVAGRTEGNRTTSLLLLSRPRSGSSLTGDILNHDPGVYYVFEPLGQIYLQTWQKIEDEDKAAQLFFRASSDKIVNAFLSCRFSDLDLSLINVHFLTVSDDTEGFSRCVKEYRSVKAKLANMTSADRQTFLQRTNITSCLKAAETNCSLAKTRVLKDLRIRVRYLTPHMVNHPDLRVVLLVRDPRASLSSMDKLKGGFPELTADNVQDFAAEFCNETADDIVSAVEMNKKYPDRIRVVRYETLAENPVRVSENMYNYLGLSWSRQIHDKIEEQTHAAKFSSRRRDFVRVSNSTGTEGSSAVTHKDNKSGNKGNKSGKKDNSAHKDKNLDEKFEDPYAVVREDSYQTAHAWRHKADWSFVQVVQAECSDLLRQLGYQIFASARDLNRTFDVPSLERTQLHIYDVKLLE